MTAAPVQRGTAAAGAAAISPRPSPGRLHFLDGLRGLAAVLVVVHHFNLVGKETLPGAYLAVDFFFALSGLVLTYAYQDRLRGPMRFATFAEVRVLRLYPLYIIGVLLGIGREAAKIAVHDPDSWGWSKLLTSSAFAALLLPDPLFGKPLYPLNTPAWSLFFELVVNLAFALLLVRLSSRWLVAVVVAALAVLVWYGVTTGSFHYGDYWDGFGAGTARVTSMFTIGVLCARFGGTGPRRLSWWTLLPAAAFVAVLAWPSPLDGRWLPDLFLVAVATPAVLLFGTRFDVPAPVERLFAWLGDISYPIYATHAPLLFCWHLLARKFALSLPVEAIGFTVGMLAFATALVPIDARIRAAVSRRLHVRRSAMPQAVKP